MRQTMLMLALAASFTLGGTAHAALHDRGGGLIYDDVLDITWLADANYAKTSGYDIDGSMELQDARNFVGTLNYSGYTGWRLPAAVISRTGGLCTGYGCGDNSELAHLFYNTLQVTAGNPVTTSASPYLPLFSNLQNEIYWSVAEIPYLFAFPNFDMRDGMQRSWAGLYFPSFNVLPVLDGDVAAPIPEPETYALMLAGLGLVGWAVQWRRG